MAGALDSRGGSHTYLLLAMHRAAGFLLEDSGLRHADDDGRIWEVEHHFDEFTWWCVPT